MSQRKQFGQSAYKGVNFPMQRVKSLGLTGVGRAQGLYMNGKLLGANTFQYSKKDELKFEEGEFINFMELLVTKAKKNQPNTKFDESKHSPIHNVRFQTNKGKDICFPDLKSFEQNREKVLKEKSCEHHVLEDIEVLKLGGNFGGSNICFLKIDFLDHSNHSTKSEAEAETKASEVEAEADDSETEGKKEGSSTTEAPDKKSAGTKATSIPVSSAVTTTVEDSSDDDSDDGTDSDSEEPQTNNDRHRGCFSDPGNYYRKRKVKKSKEYRRITAVFGHTDKGTTFDMQKVGSLGLVKDKWSFVKGLVLNGKHHGMKDKKEYDILPEVEFAKGEFINHLEVLEYTKERSNRPVADVYLKTNRGNTISTHSYNGFQNRKKQSKNKGYKYSKYENIKVLKIGGKAGKDLTLKVEFLTGYRHLPKMETREVGEARAILSVYAAFTTLTTIESSEVNRLYAANRVRNSVFSSSLEASASASGGFARASFEASMSATIGKQKTTSHEIDEEVENKVASSIRKTREVPEGYIGLELVKVKVMETEYDGDKSRWLFPLGESQVVTIPTKTKLPGGTIDLTGALLLAMPDAGFQIHRQHGFNIVCGK